MENVDYKNRAEKLRAMAEKKVAENVKKEKERYKEKVLAVYAEILKRSEISANNGEFKIIVEPSLFAKDSDDKFLTDVEFDDYLFSEVTEKLEKDGLVVQKYFTGNIEIHW